MNDCCEETAPVVSIASLNLFIINRCLFVMNVVIYERGFGVVVANNGRTLKTNENNLYYLNFAKT
jgi:hypothetical protein